MTQQPATTDKRRPSPLRGLAIGLILLVILFPSIRDILLTWTGEVIAAVVGAVLAATVLSLSGMRK